jgi:uncharacterized protein YjbI with pentapeptide repeats
LYGFDRVALVRLTVQSALAVSIVGGVIALVVDLSDREEERILRAWKVLSDAKAGGNFGQKNAVQFLHNKGQSLQKIVLRDAALAGIDLRGANLTRANLSKADLTAADLRWTNLRKADLREANLSGANLRGANLWKADLSRAHLREANLTRANLSKANLGEANLDGVTLAGVKFCRTTMPDGTKKAPTCKRP